MYKNKKISVCLPARNEAGHLLDVISAIPAIVDEIIVISNCSTDDTVKIAKRAGCKVYVDDRTISGIGYGYAHITGIQRATGDIVVGIDADGTYPIEQLTQIIDFMLTNTADFVACARKLDTKAMEWKVIMGNWLLTKEASLLYRYNFSDILTGMWLMKRSIAPQLQLSEGGWNLSPQIKINAVRHPSIKYCEYKILLHARYGKSHQKYIKTGISHGVWLYKNAFRMMTKGVANEN
jgi:glycosyltransferase involved in cell wall biosynthesis